MSKLVRVIRKSTGHKKIVSAECPQSLLIKGCEKLNIMNALGVIMKTGDDYVIDDLDSFLYVAEKDVEVFFIENNTFNESSQSESQTSIKSEPEDSFLRSSPSHWPATYHLPEMPYIDEHLSRLKTLDDATNFKLDAVLMNRFVNFLFRDMLKYFPQDDPYPTSCHYAAVCTALITKYPLLSDTSSQSGFEFWKKKLVNHFKTYRARRKPSLKQLSMKKRFGAKRMSTENVILLPTEQEFGVPSSASDSYYELMELDDIDVIKEEPSTADIMSVNVSQPSDKITNPPMLEPHRRIQILESMRASFSSRLALKTQSTAAVVEQYPHLRLPFILYQEALLAVTEFAKEAVPNYMFPKFTDLEQQVELIALSLYKALKLPLRRYSQAAPYLSWTNCSTDDKIKLGLLFAAIRMRTNVQCLFDPSVSLHIIGSPSGLWEGISVNDLSIPCNGPKQTIAAFVAASLAFNLNHPPQFANLLQAFEGFLKIRKKITYQSAKVLLASVKIDSNP